MVRRAIERFWRVSVQFFLLFKVCFLFFTNAFTRFQSEGVLSTENSVVSRRNWSPMSGGQPEWTEPRGFSARSFLKISDVTDKTAFEQLPSFSSFYSAVEPVTLFYAGTETHVHGQYRPPDGRQNGIVCVVEVIIPDRVCFVFNGAVRVAFKILRRVHADRFDVGQLKRFESTTFSFHWFIRATDWSRRRTFIVWVVPTFRHFIVNNVFGVLNSIPSPCPPHTESRTNFAVRCFCTSSEYTERGPSNPDKTGSVTAVVRTILSVVSVESLSRWSSRTSILRPGTR